MPKTATLFLTGYIMPDDWLFPGDGYYPPEPGISLARVQTAVKAAGEFDELLLDIDSGGGVIEEGWRIYDYVKSLGKPVSTRSIGVVASMATVLMMLGKERRLSPHAKFIVHQPGGGIEGNINNIQDYLNDLLAEQTRLLQAYAEGTGQAETVLAEILADGKDHEYTAQQALEFGWITGIYETETAPTARIGRKPMMAHIAGGRQALNLPEHKSQFIDMSKLGARLLAALGVASAVAAGTPLKALIVDSADGKKLDIETTGDTYVIGDPVKYEDGTDVPDGDIILSDGNTITVAGGVITAIKEPEAATNESDPAAAGEEQVTISKAEFDRLKALDTQVATLSTQVSDHAKFVARVTAVLGNMESADPIVARLPETPIERRVPTVNEDPVAALAKQRQEDRKKK